MPKAPTLPLLQPLTADTPLAALLNRWLTALAPAAALISPTRPSKARDCLLDATKGVHFFHEAVTQTIRRLESGRELKPIQKYIRIDRLEPSLAYPVAKEKLALVLAMRADRLHGAKDVHTLAHNVFRLDKLMTQPSPFMADKMLLESLFYGGFRASIELEELEPDNAPRRAYALAILRCLLAADASALCHQVGTVERRLRPANNTIR